MTLAPRTPTPVTLHAVDGDDAGPVETRSLDRAPDFLLDALPYGVIVLDAEGKVLRYNAAEARMARLDPSTVIGRAFFGDVAPCTRTAAFEGRFRSYVASERVDEERFEYVFDFTFGAQDVQIELIAGSTPGRWVLTVDRARFMPRRPEVAPDILAPRQADLAPEEARLGIRRDEAQQREVLVPASFFRAMHAAWARVAPQGWPLFTAEWGKQWGRQLVVDLEVAALQAEGVGLSELPLGRVLDDFTDRLAAHGWGAARFELGLVARFGIMPIEVEGSAVAQTVGASDTPRCQLLSGTFGALVTHLAGRRVHVEEARCASQGAERCQFLLVDHQRRRELGAQIEARGGDVAAVLEDWCGGRP